MRCKILRMVSMSICASPKNGYYALQRVAFQNAKKNVAVMIAVFFSFLQLKVNKIAIKVIFFCFLVKIIA